MCLVWPAKARDSTIMNSENVFISSAVANFQAASASTLVVATTTIILALTFAARKLRESQQSELNAPPHIPSTIPFLGHAVSFGKSPLEFMTAAYEKYGPVFSFTMMGKTFTYLIGSDAAASFFNSRNENLNAEEVYGKLTTPVFGKGVAYDVPNHIFMEQKKMLKSGMNIARFRQHIPLIEEETTEYFKRWGNSGDKDFFQALSELIILTASRCLHGKEIRSILDEKVAQLYWDLDSGFTHAAWILPAWFPLPSFRIRDRAHIKVKEMFHKIIDKRRACPDEDDILQTLIDARYKTGKALTNDEIAGMLVGLLLAGQHTSSTTTAWTMFFLAKNKDVQEAVYEEQKKVFGKELDAVDYDGLKQCQLMDRCIKESLRVRPPIMTMMRLCKTPLKVLDYVIPVGHQVCVSPPTNQRLRDTWEKCDEWDPDRFLDQTGACSEEKFSYIPFGAGRHRCIGERFAYVQIKTIMSTLIRQFEFDLVDGYFPDINFQTMIHIPNNPIIRYKRREPLVQ